MIVQIWKSYDQPYEEKPFMAFDIKKNKLNYPANLL